MNLDEKDREIIQLLQNGFPLNPEPYRVIGDKLWIDEYAVISRVVRLLQGGAIRYIGPFFVNCSFAIFSRRESEPPARMMSKRFFVEAFAALPGWPCVCCSPVKI